MKSEEKLYYHQMGYLEAVADFESQLFEGVDPKTAVKEMRTLHEQVYQSLESKLGIPEIPAEEAVRVARELQNCPTDDLDRMKAILSTLGKGQT